MDKPNTPSIPNIALASRSFGRSGPVQFINEVIAELKRVTWPTRDETMKLTVVVIAISILVGAFIGGLDSIFVAAQKLLFRQ